MTDADDISRRARDIKARAERIAEDAGDSDALRDELDRLDEELRKLDDEQRRLDDELRERGESSARAADTSSDRPAWADSVADLVADVTERITSIGSVGWPWRSSETVERSVTTDTAMPVVIENRAGSIKVYNGPVDTVTVSAELFAPSAHLLEEMEVTAEVEGPQVMIRCQWPQTRRGRHARLRVTVPTGTTVTATTSGGAITVEDTNGPATLTTKGGAITTKGTNGDVVAHTAGGAIHVDDHAGSVQASTKGGSVRIAGVLGGTLVATTAGGSIDIDGADHASVTATTSGGSIRGAAASQATTASGTAGGSVTLSIPSDNQLHVDAKGNSASSDFAELDARRGTIQGTLGDGTDGHVELRTSGGSVRVNKT